MAQRSAAATEVARRVWAPEAGDSGTAEAAAAAANRVCAQLRAGLARWVGSEGYRALLERALDRVRTEYPALQQVSCIGDDEEEMAAAVRAHGSATVAAGVVALVVTIIDLLGRVIGEEMAAELVRQAGTVKPRRTSNPGNQGELDG